MNGKLRFCIYNDQRGEWRWRLKAANGKIVAEGGEGYKEWRKLTKTLSGVIGKISREHYAFVREEVSCMAKKKGKKGCKKCC